MTKIKSGAICLLFFLCLGSALFFLSPCYLVIGFERVFIFLLPLQHFSHFIYFTHSACIVYGSGTGVGDLVRFGYL